MTAATTVRPPAPRRRARQPLLLAMVFAVFLVVIGCMAIALTVLVSAHFSAAALSNSISHDRALVRLWADGNLTSADLDPDRIPPARTTELVRQLATLVERGEILHMEVRLPDGVVLFSNDEGIEGRRAPASAEFAESVSRRQPTTSLLATDVAAEAIGFASSGPLLREYLPIISANGDVAAIVGIWRDATPILERLEATRGAVLMVTGTGAVVLAAVLFIVFRAAQRRLARQSRALVEGTRRDPLSGLLNHGAIVAGLAERLAVARGAGAPVGVAIVDIDNFRLLNDTYGHTAGDAVLLRVSQAFGTVAPPGTLVGRYGPDEFLLIGPPMAVELVEHIVDQLRIALRAVGVRFGDSETLPVTVSAGLATFPDSAEAVTDLLMATTAAVAEAKASGGDTVRASIRDGQPETIGKFSIFQGLVAAIDTKDHYTKRHSEDVARYALFMGQRMGLSNDALETLRLAALLHDLGKVGIPDALLHKPGRLTPEEREIFEQHVVLGDLIVRDLPNLDEVRAGVRHHHERWDGAGYPDRLVGEAIPWVARILAVADTFSAMTTTRPYRKALNVEEALRRLADVAGSQLDERMVKTFVGGMASAPDAPRPSDEQARPLLWTPRVEAA